MRWLFWRCALHRFRRRPEFPQVQSVVARRVGWRILIHKIASAYFVFVQIFRFRGRYGIRVYLHVYRFVATFIHYVLSDLLKYNILGFGWDPVEVRAGSMSAGSVHVFWHMKRRGHFINSCEQTSHWLRWFVDNPWIRSRIGPLLRSAISRINRVFGIGGGSLVIAVIMLSVGDD